MFHFIVQFGVKLNARDLQVMLLGIYGVIVTGCREDCTFLMGIN